MASNCSKRVLEAAKLAYANKTKESITSQKRVSRDVWRKVNSVLNKGKSAIPPLFKGLEVFRVYLRKKAATAEFKGKGRRPFNAPVVRKCS